MEWNELFCFCLRWRKLWKIEKRKVRVDWIGLDLYWIVLDLYWIGLDLYWIGFGLDLDWPNWRYELEKIENRLERKNRETYKDSKLYWVFGAKMFLSYGGECPLIWFDLIWIWFDCEMEWNGMNSNNWWMNDGWWMMDDGWLMMDEWWMMMDEWWMMDDGWSFTFCHNNQQTIKIDQRTKHNF